MAQPDTDTAFKPFAGTPFGEDNNCEETLYFPVDILTDVIAALNHNRQKFLETHDKKFWWQMIQLLPSSYNQLRTVDLNYEVLHNIYHARKNHKLDEWHVFCEWIENLPYSEIITCEKEAAE